MKKIFLIIIILITVLILAGIVVEFFLQKKEAVPLSSEVVSLEEKFYSYLELPSRNGKFLEFDEAKSEISILYFNTETMKINQETFKIDKDTIFSKVAFDHYQPDLFSQEDLKKVKQETQTKIFYLLPEKENEIPLARLIQVESLF